MAHHIFYDRPNFLNFTPLTRADAENRPLRYSVQITPKLAFCSQQNGFKLFTLAG